MILGTGCDLVEIERMKKACELLKDKTMKVKDVSLAVGYENVSYFGSAGRQGGKPLSLPAILL